MTVVDDYLDQLSGSDRQVIEPMYQQVRTLVPDATEELSYAMPAFKYKGKGLYVQQELLQPVSFLRCLKIGLGSVRF